jgi:predicted PurR-regulated permease PerM
MSEPTKLTEASIEKVLMEVLVRFGLVVFLIYLCASVFAPFTGILLWGLIMAIALYPLHRKLARRLGDNPRRASVIIIVGFIAVLGVPILILGHSFASHLHSVYTDMDAGSWHLSPPNPSVAKWPVIGEQVYDFWNKTAADFPAFLKENELQVKAVSEHLLKSALSGAKVVLRLFGAFLIAGVMMAYGKMGNLAIERVFSRFAGEENGADLQTLCTGTVRSVAMGVLGVALIQAVLFGLGFMLIGLNTAGVLAFVVFFIGVIQLPTALVSLPVIIYMWYSGDHGVAMNVVFTIYFTLAGLVDNVLKPMLLGRGVDAPMPIILIGALGGLVSAGFIGLFVGAVILAVGYKVFVRWVAMHPRPQLSDKSTA